MGITFRPDSIKAINERKAKERAVTAFQRNLIMAAATGGDFSDCYLSQHSAMFEVFDPENPRPWVRGSLSRCNVCGELFRAEHDIAAEHAGTSPSESNLWVRVLPATTNGYPNWESGLAANTFMNGSRAWHNDILWESTVDHNIWEPGTVANIWIQVSIRG